MGKKRSLIELIKKYRLGKASSEEKAFIERYYQQFDKGERISESLSEAEKEKTEQRIFSKIKTSVELSSLAPVVPIYRRLFFRVAAACLLILSGIGVYLILNQRSPHFDLASKHLPTYQNDLIPGSNKAILTLADGSTIILDSAVNGNLALQGNTKVVKLDAGQLAYNSVGPAVGEAPVFNTIATPRGGQYQVILPDGTRAWLNAASSIRFPAAFVDSERKVEVMGEVYFEVTHNDKKPFIVQSNDVTVRVLGTHFNINTYLDENDIKITLLTGSVRVDKGANVGMLKPGQQARVNGDIKVVNDIDVDEVMAWKNGVFQFGDKADIYTIMRQISRWYDVDIEYKEPIKGHIGGSVSRNVNVSQVLAMLEKTGAVKFTIEGRKVIVRP